MSDWIREVIAPVIAAGVLAALGWIITKIEPARRSLSTRPWAVASLVAFAVALVTSGLVVATVGKGIGIQGPPGERGAPGAQGPRGDASPNQAAPIGTIIASMFEPKDFAVLINETEGADLSKRTWVLADGRQVNGTQYAIHTGDRKIPDLRGQFLRGIQIGREAGDVQKYGTALPSKEFTGITSKDGGHIHQNGIVFGTDKYDVPGGPVQRPYAGPTDQAGAHTHTVTINGGGDDETRPTNVAVYYYIKIN